MKIKELKNKTRCKDYIKNEILTLPLGTIIGPDHKHFELLDELRRLKQDDLVGIASHFIVTQCPYNGKNKNITYVSTNGFIKMFSASKCLDPDESNKTLFISAMREIIRPQLNEYRNKYFYGRTEAPSELSGVMLQFGPDAHVDHIDPSFASIIETFIHHYKIDVDKLTFCKGEDKKDKVMEAWVNETFYEFHKKHAKLRVASRDENLKRPKTCTIFKVN